MIDQEDESLATPLSDREPRQSDPIGCGPVALLMSGGCLLIFAIKLAFGLPVLLFVWLYLEEPLWVSFIAAYIFGALFLGLAEMIFDLREWAKKQHRKSK